MNPQKSVSVANSCCYTVVVHSNFRQGRYYGEGSRKAAPHLNMDSSHGASPGLQSILHLESLPSEPIFVSITLSLPDAGCERL